MYTLDLGFKKIPCTLYIYVLGMIYKIVQSLGIQKLAPKIIGIWATSDK